MKLLLLCLFTAPPFTTWKDKRKWRPKYWRKPLLDSSSSEEEQSVGPIKYGNSEAWHPLKKNTGEKNSNLFPTLDI